MEQQPLSSVTIRPITAADDPFIAKIIRTNFEQYHLTIPGTAYFDPELDHLSAFYNARPGRGYFVAVDERGTVLGGCGFAEAAVFDRCAELQKLYLSDAAKGKRVGRRLSETVEQAARDAGYETLYIETHSKFDAAIRLYEKLGFQQIDKPQGVQHGAMDHFYLKSL